MSRRQLSYAVFVVTSVVLAACAQPVAPRGEDTIKLCRGGVTVGSGYQCPPE